MQLEGESEMKNNEGVVQGELTARMRVLQSRGNVR